MSEQTEFFTIASMSSFTGATAITFVVANGIQRAFNFNPKWLALAIAEFVVILGVVASGRLGLLEFVLAIVNGFLVFSAAFGTTEVAANLTDSGIRPQAVRSARRLLSSWLS